MQLSEIRTIVRYRLRETTASVWSDAELTNEINIAQRYVASIVNAKYMPEILTIDSSQTTVSGTSEYTLPSNFLKFAGYTNIGSSLYKAFDDPVEAYRISFLSANDIDADNKIVWAANNKLNVHPTPSSSGDTIKIVYVKVPDELVNDSDEADLNDTLLDFVIDIAASNALKKTEPEKAYALLQSVMAKMKGYL